MPARRSPVRHRPPALLPTSVPAVGCRLASVQNARIIRDCKVPLPDPLTPGRSIGTSWGVLQAAMWPDVVTYVLKSDMSHRSGQHSCYRRITSRAYTPAIVGGAGRMAYARETRYVNVIRLVPEMRSFHRVRGSVPACSRVTGQSVMCVRDAQSDAQSSWRRSAARRIRCVG